MQAETLVTVVILTNQFDSKLVKSLLSIPKNWTVLICSPTNRLPMSISQLHRNIRHRQMPDQNIQDFSQMRNLALQQVKTEWAFFLDSDEVINEFDINQLEIKLHNQQIAGLTITRSDVFYGQKLHYGEAGKQQLTRLVQVDQSHFAGQVHEVAVVKGQVADSRISISHFSHDSVSQFMKQVSRYANMSATLHQSKSGLRLLTELLIYPPLKFLLNYIVKLGFLDGWRGLIYALIMSLHSTLVRLMTLEHRVRHAVPIQSGSASTNSVINKRFGMLQLGLSLGLLFLLPFGQLLRWSITDSVVIYPHDVILSLIVLLYTIDIFRNKSKTIWQKLKRWRWEVLVWGYFWLLGVIKLLIGNDPHQFLIMSRLGVYALGLLIAIKSINQCRINLHNRHLQAKLLWIVGLGLFAWLSFVLYLIFPDMRSLAFFGWDDHYYRLIGTLFDPNYTGLVLSVGILMTLGWIGLKNRSYSSIVRWLLPVLSLLFSICLGLTFSRSSWLSLVVAITGLFIVALIKKQFVLKQLGLILATGLVILATVVFAPKPGGEGVDLTRSASVNSRLAFDQYIFQSLNTSDFMIGKLVDKPLSDLNQIALTSQSATNSNRSANTPVDFHPKTANNLFVTSLFWGGIVGLTLVIILFGRWLWQLYQISPLALSILIAWFVHAQFNNSFLEPFVFLFVGGSILSIIFEMLDRVQHDGLFTVDK